MAKTLNYWELVAGLRGLRVTDYGLRFTKHGLQVKGYGLRVTR